MGPLNRFFDLRRVDSVQGDMGDIVQIPIEAFQAIQHTASIYRFCIYSKTSILEPLCKAIMDGMEAQQPTWRTRLLEGKFPDREFDIAFWQAQGDEAIFQAAWEMVVVVEEARGRKPVLDKSVTALNKMSG